MSTHNRRLPVSVAALVIAAGGSAAWAQTGHPIEVRQTLDASVSSYTSQGCLEPCMCLVYEPPYSGPLSGGFTMRFSRSDPFTVYYDVTDVALATDTVVEPGLRYSGWGTYEYGGDFVLTHRLVLTLTPQRDGVVGEPQVFDSGYVIVGVAGGEDVERPFPAMSIRLQTPIVDCSKRWMLIATDAEVVTPHCRVDLGGQGGEPFPDGRLDNNDFVVFIDSFFAGDARADMGMQGGEPGSDGAFDNNDFVVFVDRFFDGC